MNTLLLLISVAGAHRILYPLLLALVVTNSLLAADAGFTLDKTPSGGLIIKHNGQTFAEYIVDQANKPYLAPVFGPTGKQMTRDYPMKKIEGEQQDYPHHRGICFGHEDVNGAEFWAEKATFDELNAKKPGSGDARLAKVGATKHREYREVKADKGSAIILDVIDWVDAAGNKLMEEERRMTFSALAGTRIIDLDQELIATVGDVKFADKKDAGLSIRVPDSMAVKTKPAGGHIITSEGKTDKDAWATHAKWCDYYGPVEGETLGVAVLNHPSSFRYPTGWHVRTYGLFTANPFASKQFDKTAPDAAFVLKAGEHLKLRHRFIFHSGDEKAAKIEAAWQSYAKE